MINDIILIAAKINKENFRVSEEFNKRYAETWLS